MSVYANTLNAYAARIKAQRKAAEREAQAQARAKSAEQKLADKMRIEAERLLKQRQQQEALTPTLGVEMLLDKVIRQIKNDYNEILLTGERVKIKQDLAKLAELFFYQGAIPGNVAHVVVDATKYSNAAFAAIMGVMIHLEMVQEEGACSIVECSKNMRQIVCFRNNRKASITFVNSNTSSIERAKQDFVKNSMLRSTGVFYTYDEMETV